MTKTQFARIRVCDAKNTVSSLEWRLRQFLPMRRMARLDGLRGSDDPPAESRNTNGAKKPTYPAYIPQPDIDTADNR